MLTFTDDRFARGPSLIGRRDFLRIGSLGGLALPELLTTRSQAAMDRNVFRNKSVVFLFLQGGPPQLRFEPQPRALALLATADRQALACYGPLALRSRAALWLKNRLDTDFMRSLQLDCPPA